MYIFIYYFKVFKFPSVTISCVKNIFKFLALKKKRQTHIVERNAFKENFSTGNKELLEK